MPGLVLEVDAVSIRERVTTAVPKILDQAQNSTANHQKNLVALYKVQKDASEYMERVKKGVRLMGERIFEEEILQMLTRALSLKKGTTPADRIIKFISSYIKFVHEKAAEERNVAEVETDDEDTMASRFTARILNFLLKGFLAKDKSVRYRVLQTVAEMVAHLGEIDEEIYTKLRAALLDRVNDKEAPVRVQAIIALSKLAGSEEPTELDDGETTVTDVLIDLLAHDTSAEVRRAVVCNIPITSTTLPHILDRSRDTDTIVRKLVYHAVLEPNVMVRDTDNMGPTHPRSLTIAQRELIVRSGLGDREPIVTAAAKSLLATWVDAVTVKEENGKVESGVVALLNMFDLAESSVATDALISIFETRPDIFDNMEFGDDYWTNLTPEMAFLARVFVEHCKASKDDTRLEVALPVVTALAFRIQEAYNDLIEDVRNEEEERVIRDLNEDEKSNLEEQRLDKESIIGEMLRLAVNLDYSDEIGRRKMFQLVRDMLSMEELPESFLSKCLDVLRELSTNERDLIRVVVEIVQDLRDPGENVDEEDPNRDVDAETTFGETPATVRPPRVPKPVEEKTPEEKAHADKIDLRCLSMCIGMLERVNSTFDENSTLDGVLRELIIPSVKRKELEFKEKGLISLGLCCLIARRLALGSIRLFLDQIAVSPEALKLSVLQVIFDMLMVHENDFLGKNGGDNAKNLTNFLFDLLKAETSQKVQALLCMGLSKLFLSGMITDVLVLKNLIMSYFDSATTDNQELRQCLTFFFPVYCYSSPTNQRCMREIFIEMFKRLNESRSNLEEDQEMVGAAQVGALFVDWTDPLKLSKASTRGNPDTKNETNESIHLDMAHDIFETLLKEEYEKEDKKVLCQLLNKLHIPDSVDDDKIRKIKLLMHNLRLRRPLRDATTNNAFTKFETAFCKKFEKQLEDFDEVEYRKLEQLQDLFKFLDEIIPEDDDDIDADAPKKRKKRRSGSMISTSTEGDREDTASIASRRRSRTKRQRLSTSDNESEDEITELPTPPPPTRKLPKRSAATKKPIQIIEISSDSDGNSTPVPRASRAKQRKIKEEARVDKDVDDPLDEGNTTEIPFDSIMDDDSEEEEDVVNDLLVPED